MIRASGLIETLQWHPTVTINRVSADAAPACFAFKNVYLAADQSVNQLFKYWSRNRNTALCKAASTNTPPLSRWLQAPPKRHLLAHH